MSAIDWALLAVYLVGVGVVGLMASKRARTVSELNLAGRSMPAWAVSVSVLATALSAVTFIGAPQDAYAGDLTYLSLSLGSVLGACLVAFVFLPRYYRLGVTTVYDVIGRTGSPSAQRACASVFLAGRVLASGTRLYVAAIPCALIVFGRVDAGALVMSVVMIAAVAVFYTSMGGVRAVIWTDVLQASVFVLAAGVSIAVLADRIPLDAGGMVRVLRESGDKLRVVDLSTDLAEPYTLWSALIGFTLLNAAAFGTDQDLAQRLLTCRSGARAAGSLIASSVLGIAMTGLFLVIGLLLYVAHRTGAVADQTAGDTRRVFVDFILTDTPAGVRGVMLAGVFAAAMSSLDSALNAMSTSLMNDFGSRSGRSGSVWGVARARAVSAGFGVVLAGVAIGCAAWQQGSEEGLIVFALGVMVYAYAGLLGVFLAVLVFGRGSAVSLTAGLVAGVVTVAALQWGPVWWPGAVQVSLGWRMAAGTAVSLVVALAGTPAGPERRGG